ncbi:MAG: hypothetical protein ACXWCZ_00600, partial [Flavisolibacter sp.]
IYFKSVQFAFKEAHRIIKPGGALIVGFLDKDSIIGKEYEARKQFSVFYKQAMFYTPERIVNELKMAGFKKFKFSQTLFNPIEDIKVLEAPKQGFGEGSFVVINAIKK